MGDDDRPRMGTGGRLESAETITARTGRDYFTGVILGLLATGNGRRSTAPADFDWFETSPPGEKVGVCSTF